MKQLKVKFLFTLFLCYVLTACNNLQQQNTTSVATSKTPGEGKIIRYGMVTGVRAEKLEYYKQLHAKPWKQVIKKIEECNIRNYSIFLEKIGDSYFLFSYFEYTGNDFDADMKKMAADKLTQQWWKETDPCQIPLPEAMLKHQVWTQMEEIFHSN